MLRQATLMQKKVLQVASELAQTEIVSVVNSNWAQWI